MKWTVNQNKSFADIVEFQSAGIRSLLDLQFRSLLMAERELLEHTDFRAIKILDFGAGEQGFTKRNHCGQYKTVDPYFPANWKTVQDIPSTENFDLIVSTEVFEHLESPAEVLKSLSKFQTRGQKIYMTTPFLAREHGAPEDFQRWTEMGMIRLLESAGYKVDKLIRRGNLISVVSAFLNYKLFKGLRSIYFLPALLLAPFVLIVLLLAQLTLTFNKNSSTYLGLSVLATKSED